MAEGLSGAGQFKIDDARILTSSGLEVNILPSIIAITLYEDTEMMTVSGNILMQDSGNLASIGPIIGQEYLFLKIRTPSFQNESAIIDYTKNALVINNLQGRSDIGNNVHRRTTVIDSHREKTEESAKGKGGGCEREDSWHCH